MSPRKKKPRRGRPPGPPENVRRRVFLIRLTDAEFSVFASAAEEAQESVADWAREVLLAACKVSGSRRQP